MRDFEISERLERILKKIRKKDKVRYEATLKKIEDIVTDYKPEHYKNLKGNMKEFKRVHIDRHFVLIFKEKGEIIQFIDLQHHDTIYK